MSGSDGISCRKAEKTGTAKTAPEIFYRGAASHRATPRLWLSQTPPRTEVVRDGVFAATAGCKPKLTFFQYKKKKWVCFYESAEIGFSLDQMNLMLVHGGHPAYGHRIGILVLDSTIPRIPGDLGNATTYPFPAPHKVVRGATASRVVGDTDPALLKPCRCWRPGERSES